MKDRCGQSRWNASLLICAAGIAAAFCVRPAHAGSSDCINAAPYVMPEGVELGPESDPGVAPADVAPSPMKQAIPDTFHFPLKVDPLPDQLPNASIDLGDVGIDSKTGRAMLNGQPLSKSDAADAAAGCAGAEKGKGR